VILDSALRQFKAIVSGAAVNTGSVFAITLYAAGNLSSSEFGALSLLLSLALITSQVLDFGTSLSLVRVARTNEGRLNSFQLFSAILLFKFAAHLILAILLALSVSKLGSVFKVVSSEVTIASLEMANFASAAVGCWLTIRAKDQAQGVLERVSAKHLLIAAARVICFLLLLARDGRTTVTEFIAVLYCVPYAVVVAYELGLQLLAGEESVAAKRDRMLGKLFETFKYGGVVALSMTLYALALRLPIFYLGMRGTPDEVARYGVALAFAGVFTLINDAARTVMLPYAIDAKTPAQRQKLRNSLVRLSAGYLAGTCLLLAACAGLALVATRTSAMAVVPISILGLTTAITVFVGILNMTVHAIGKPLWDALVNLVRLVALVVLVPILDKGANEMAIAYGATLVAGELLLYVILTRHDRGLEQAKE
jgi:O-antigen/teichoic acid export membrane protein